MSDSFLTAFKRLDVYRTVPKDLTQQTAAGASISIFTCGVIFILFMTEFIGLITVQTKHEMFVEHPLTAAAAFNARNIFWPIGASNLPRFKEESELMKINFNITLPRMACAITNVGVQDVLGTDIDVHSQVRKFRTDSNGQLKFDATSGRPLSGDYGLPKDQVNEGCQLDGHIKVPMVPGSVHFSSNAHPEILQLFFANTAPGLHGAGGNLNTSHIINELYFGETQKLRDTGLTTALAPLNGGTKWSLDTEVANGNEKSYEYFIKAIPTVYQPLRGAPIKTYQFVSNSNEIVGRFRMPAIFFRVRYTHTTHTTLSCSNQIGRLFHSHVSDPSPSLPCLCFSSSSFLLCSV